MTVQLISLLPLYICYDIIFFHTFHIPLVLLQLISNNRQSTLEMFYKNVELSVGQK